MMVIDNKFEMGQEVYLKTDAEQLKRIVCSFEVFPQAEILYKLACGSAVSNHYSFEITDTKDVVTSLTS